MVLLVVVPIWTTFRYKMLACKLQFLICYTICKGTYLMAVGPSYYQLAQNTAIHGLRNH